MKKGCLAVFAGLMLLVAGTGFVLAIQADRQYGLTQAGAISHARFANDHTRLRAVLAIDRLEDYILAHLPKDAALPKWLPMELSTLVSKALPREAALLAGSNYAREQVEVMFFLNERRGGPAIAAMGKVMQPPPALRSLEWEEPLLSMPERGVIQAKAVLPIPEGLEERLLEDWPHDVEGGPLELEGGHVFEFLLDNRNGEAFTLTGALLQASGQDWRQAMDQQGVVLALGVLPLIHDCRLQADLTGPDTMSIRLRVDGDPGAAMACNVVAGMAIPQLKQDLQKKYGLLLEGQAAWSDEENALLGDFTLSGFEPLVNQYIQLWFPKSAPAS